ncbi:MAG: winged helix-turn-helix transcriptional regulator [Clostridia bacterium]|nr:winged helix-turn-helix transcriptional regulator [Clostridia bacterium]
MLTRYERFTASIAGISRSIQKIETDEMKKYSLKGSHAQLLVVLSQNPEGITAARLCVVCDKDKAAVSRGIAELELNGMVKKDGGINYRSRLLLTKKGKEVAMQICKRVEAAVKLAETNVSEEESNTMFRVLDEIASELREACKDGLPV